MDEPVSVEFREFVLGFVLSGVLAVGRISGYHPIERPRREIASVSAIDKPKWVRGRVDEVASPPERQVTFSVFEDLALPLGYLEVRAEIQVEDLMVSPPGLGLRHGCNVLKPRRVWVKGEVVERNVGERRGTSARFHGATVSGGLINR